MQNYTEQKIDIKLIDNNGWSNEDEKILKEWADKAQCYEWMHQHAYKSFHKKYLLLTIPVIIISTITGTANFAQERIPIDYQSTYTMIVGGFSIFAGMISTIAQFMKISELRSNHEHASKDWDKFSRNIKIELVKNRKDRTHKKTMIELSKKEYDRLLENSPSIPTNIAKLFSEKFNHIDDLIKPEICDNIYPIEIYKEPEQIQLLPRITSEDNMINKLKHKFFELNGRYPTEFELDDIKEYNV